MPLALPEGYRWWRPTSESQWRPLVAQWTSSTSAATTLIAATNSYGWFYGNQYVMPADARVVWDVASTTIDDDPTMALAGDDAPSRARVRAMAIERERAIERAELLLRESLSAAQLEELSLHGRITMAVYDKRGCPRIFVLRRGRVANILELNAEGGHVARWCVHPRLDVPDADTMLAQKLWLESDCDALLSIANRHPI